MLFYSLILFFANAFLISPAIAISVASETDYPKFCLRAAHDDTVFSTFRSHDLYRLIVENVSYQEGLQFEKIITTNYKNILPPLNKIIEEDCVGTPVAYEYQSLGLCSPVVLRYIKIAGDIKKEFGELKNLRIVEIGGGFGGQCKVLHDTFGFASYTLIDLPPCISLANKYLSYFNIENVRILSNINIKIPQQYDLVISNYAISEIDREEQLHYLNNIINLAPRGYITYNLQPSFDPFTLKEFVDLLSQDHNNMRIEAEYPSTGADNFVIIWHPNQTENVATFRKKCGRWRGHKVFLNR